MAKSRTTKTKAPTGLSISRNGTSFTLSWKIGDSDYADGQWFSQWIDTNGKDGWSGASKLGAKTTAKTISINKAKYYPNTGTYLRSINMRVKGDRKTYKTGKKKKTTYKPGVSSWSAKSFAIKVCDVPNLTATLDEQLTNVCKFDWDVTVDDTSSKVFTNVEWQTILVKNSAETDGSKLDWSKAEKGSTGANSSKTITEDTSILYKNGDSYVRWFRVRSRGPAGDSAWRYAYHVYALPKQANVSSAEAKETDEGGFQCIVDWEAPANRQNPIDMTTAQYTIVVPDEGLTCPSGASWNDAIISADTENMDSAVFGIDDQLSKDQCLFIRINTTHDGNVTYGKPQLAKTGYLKDPSGLTVSTDNTTHRATVNATNNSEVDDSVLVVRYVPTTGEPLDVGIITNGSVTVQCPNWDDQKAIAFEVYAMVGSYRKQERSDGVSSYIIEPKMRSLNTLSDGGAVPSAPENVTVSRTEIADTVRVTWDWSWAEANGAEISWADHNDAWESTDEPSSYTISNLHASKWNISGLETGKTWYVRVRLLIEVGDDVTYGPWSDISQGEIDLSSAPNKPVLMLSDPVIPEDGSTTANWVYTTTDNTAQSYAEVAVIVSTIGTNQTTTQEDNSVDTIVVGERVDKYYSVGHTQTAQHVTIEASTAGWTVGNVYNLACRVRSASGKLSEWSDPVSVTIADPLTADITETSLINADIEVNPRTFTGNPIQFNTDLEETVTDMEVTLEPIQDLSHGAPSPENICPISGWDSVEAYDTGINVWDEEWESGGINTSGQETTTSGYYRSTNYISVLPNANYYFKTPTSMHVMFYDANKDFIDWTTANNSAITTPSNGHYLRFRNSTAGGWQPYNHDISINYPATDTEYHAYNGHTHTATFDETVYGGTVDLVSGVLTIDRAMLDLGTLTWNKSGDSPQGGFIGVASPSGNLAKAYGRDNIISTAYATNADKVGIPLLTNGMISGQTSNRNIFVRDDRASTPAEIKTLLSGVYAVYELAEPRTIQLSPQTITTLVGVNNVWSDGDIKMRIAEMVEHNANVLDKMPLTVTVTGAGNGGLTTLAIERASSYFIEGPAEDDFNGYEGETIANLVQVGDDQFTISNDQLIGELNDGASYRLVATVNDGLGQKAVAEKDFRVKWEHQALRPSVTIAVDEEQLIAKITPVAPQGVKSTDRADIYRLSIDKPVLIYRDAEFGKTYVDPYPTLGDMGGYRVVLRTENNDYITVDNEMAWVDTIDLEDIDQIDNDDQLTVVDFDSKQLRFYFDTDYSSQWAKDFKQTQYMGGHVQGDWNPAVDRTGTIGTLAIPTLDQEMLRVARRLAEFPGHCHVRTPDGSSYVADVQLSEDRVHDDQEMLVTYSMSITRVDNPTLDGVTLEQWESENEEES